ncbi:MAG: ABC transporter ATP-binding protein [Thermoanaerobaculia bacterium]
MSPQALLEVRELGISFPRGGRRARVVRGASFDVGRGEVVGLVGESGSGKSVTALAALRLVPPPGRIDGGSIRLAGEELLDQPERAMRRVRGGRIGLVFQEPMSALNPVFTVGSQIAETVRLHRDVSRREAREEARRLLELVAIPAPESRLDDYPHQLSGGQRQRAVIAIALAGGPELLIADEPTTALDVTIQAQILRLLLDLRDRLGLTVLLITHDLAVVAETCDRAVVLYAGQVVETAPVARLFEAPAHPYTRGLLAAVPVLGRPAPRGRLPTIAGQVPEVGELPAGCAFHPRCPQVMDVCRVRDPETYPVAPDQAAHCFLHAPVGLAHGDAR